jgi:hypothetical protein
MHRRHDEQTHVALTRQAAVGSEMGGQARPAGRYGWDEDPRSRSASGASGASGWRWLRGDYHGHYLCSLPPRSLVRPVRSTRTAVP